jgi:PleD family two-component response regulator
MSSNTQILRRPLVLVATDGQPQSESIQDALQQFGFRCKIVNDSENAFAHFVATPPDAILLDLQQPAPDSFALCTRIRKHESGGELPIFIAANRDDDAIDRAYRVGATDIVFNPISLPVLPHRLRYALRTAKWRTA